jgi:hypothetical protein
MTKEKGVGESDEADGKEVGNGCCCRAQQPNKNLDNQVRVYE